MLTLLAAWSFSLTRRLTQLGFLLDAIGAGLLVVAAGLRLWRDRPVWLWILALAGVLLAAGFVLLILGVHWGVSPYSPRR